jgi:hypothetical protein
MLLFSDSIQINIFTSVKDNFLKVKSRSFYHLDFTGNSEALVS